MSVATIILHSSLFTLHLGFAHMICVTYIFRDFRAFRVTNMKQTIISFLLALSVISCANYKDIPYFQNAAEVDLSQSAHLYEMTIKLHILE